MSVFPRLVLAFASLLPVAAAAQTQPLPSPAPLSEDSVRVMSGLVQTSVRQLRGIYFEPNDVRAVQLIETALVEVPAYNQRLSHYTASLPREQQQLLAQRLRQQPWQVELNTLLRSPQFKEFNVRAAKNPALKAAAERLQNAGFIGAVKPAPAKPASTPAAPAVAAGTSLDPAPAQTPVKSVAPATAAVAGAAKPQSLAPSSSATVTKPAAAAPAAPVKPVRSHTVQKGQTLFSIARQYHVTPAQLQEWNNKPDGSVRVGEVLTVEASK